MPSAGRLRYLDMPAKLAPGGAVAGTLVLIHAFPLSARMWEPQREITEHGWRIIAPQLRDFDGSGDNPPVASIDDYAGDIVDLLDTLHVEDAVIGGASLGGYVTFAVFRNAPRYFRGIVLADTRPQADTAEGVENRKKMLATLSTSGVAAVADDMLPKLLGETTRQTLPAIVDHVRALILSNQPAALSGAVTAMMGRPDSTPSLSALHIPALIVVGEEDTLTPPALSEAMRAAIGGSELITIPKAGHLPNLEQPELFNQALARFLAHRV